jgi:hypothetical protein
MQSSNVGAVTLKKNAPIWLKNLVDPPSIQPHLLGDVFWSFNSRSSASSHVQKSAYDLSYLAFALRKFTLTRFDVSEAPAEVLDFDDIFQLRAAFISDYDHYCSDESSGKHRLEISLQQQLPCDSVAESLQPNLMPQVVRDVLQDVISTHNHGWEFFEKHTADFYEALTTTEKGESEFPNEIREKLEKYGQPSDQPLGNFELLSCCCIFQFYSRYANNQDEIENPPLTSSNDGSLPHRARSCDDLDVPRRYSIALERTCKDDLQLHKDQIDQTLKKSAMEPSTQMSRPQPSAAANKYDSTSEMLKLRAYLRDLHRTIVNLQSSIYKYNTLDWAKEGDVTEKFVELQRVLVEHKDLLFYGENDSDKMRIMRNDHVALAFRVLRQMILDTEYFEDLRRSIDEHVAKFNTALKEKNVDVVRLTNERFGKLCTAVALEQLHFTFDLLETMQSADLGFRIKTSVAGMGAQPPSAPQGAAAAVNGGVAERAIEQPSSAGVAAADNAVYTWLDLKGTVLQEALANELEADLKKYDPRKPIFKRLCSFACA